ncbi:antirestriction protein [Proteus terrae]|uniref:antirestriction protein n=1 Tax=Proteus terrae TaxID=1574161 RepID=UPI0034E3BEEE
MTLDELYPITKNVISSQQRDNFWFQYFRAVPLWIKLESQIFHLMDSFCDEYYGAFWEYCVLSNQGAFIYPALVEKEVTLFNPHNGNEAILSPEAVGIAICLIVFSLWSFKTESEFLVERFYQLRDYAIQHPESSTIFHLID